MGKRQWTEEHTYPCPDTPFEGVSYDTREGPLRVTVSRYSHEGVRWHVWDTDNRQEVTERSQPLFASSTIRMRPMRWMMMNQLLAHGQADSTAIAKIKALAAARRLAPSRMLPAPPA